eukprot:gene4278-7614_t
MSKLTKLRELFTKFKIDGYIVPSEDAHQSEYVTKRDQRREFVSNFSGSAGTALITKDEALLWTDGRYFLQAENELDKEWKLMKQGIDVDLKTYLKNNLKEKTIGIDGLLFSVESYKNLSKESKIEIVPENLVDQIWESQPSFPENLVFHLDVKYSGVESKNKIEDIRQKMKENSTSYILLSALDEVAWVLNLRGSDISYNPVFLSYLIISQDKIFLFSDKKIKMDLDGFELKPYNEILNFLNKIEEKVWIDINSSSISLYKSIKNPHEEKSPIAISKGIKNEIELQGMRDCQVRDGVALVKFFCWLEEELKNGNENLTEVSVADHLEFLRSQQKDYVSLSFSTISGMGSNGAIIHYSPEKEKCAKINDKEIFLLDSGAQYLDGTTDTTRTVHFGEPTDYEKECFTNVLKGHIELDSLIFPHGTTGNRLDLVARMHLWKNGQDFKHGVGHGVGHFLNVHEGPHGIGSRDSSKVKFEKNMVVTNEPGYYESGKFGIRIENIMIVKESETKYKSDTKFFEFEHITCVPIQTKLIDSTLLTKKEIEWVNNYNEFCYNKLKDSLNDDEKTLSWLNINTEPI